ncbi:MAG TPA: MFS transporter [Acidimicrobiales bacterium]|nr:MFS transporter [Acidimicrobiales bacterium]
MTDVEVYADAGDPVAAIEIIPAHGHASAEVVEAVDRRRLRSTIGMALGLVGPRANLAVSGVLLTLLVSARTSTALGITFALTANRLVGWLAYPLLGRASDRTAGRAGRRAPYMAAGLVVMGACTWAYTVVPGYWALVALVAAVKTASVVFGLTNVAAVPETFGKSRSIKAAVVIGILGALVSLVVKGTVIATWKTGDPSTWNLAFRMAGAIMIVAAVIVLVLVREAPVGHDAALAARKRHDLDWRSEARRVMAVPNARVLVAGVLVFWAGLSATGYLAVVYFQRIQHAGAGVQTIAGWVMGAPVTLFGFAAGFGLSRMLTRRQVAVITPALGAVIALLQFFSTHIWQTVVLAFVGAPLFTAFVISLAPMLLQLLPRGGGMGELLGKLVAPFSAFAVAFSFLAAWAVDASGDYRMIWLFPAAAGIAQAVIMCWLRVPKSAERPSLDGLPTRIADWLLEQVSGPGRSVLRGEVTAADADAGSLFETARTLLGDPYLSTPDESVPEGNNSPKD